MAIELSQFIANWYGPPDAPPSPLSAEHRWLPEPLKEFYILSSQWSTSLMSLKKMLAPEQLKASDHRVIFMEDPTGDWRWAFDTRDPSIVYEAELYGEWDTVQESLPEFLIHNALSEATYNARSSRDCSHVEEHWLADILAPMTEVGFGGWRWPDPGYRIFISETLVAEIGPAIDQNNAFMNMPGYSDVRVASNNPEHLAHLDRMPDIKWIKA